MDNQPVRSKRQQALIEKYGGEEGYRAHMSAIAAKAAANRKVNKGGTSESAKKGYATSVERYGLNWHSDIGRSGGKANRRKSNAG